MRNKKRNSQKETYRNEDSYIKPEELGGMIPPYRPTFKFDGSFINPSHEFYSRCDVKEDILIDIGIPGWLRKEDALKLYELAFFSDSDILELGTCHGLSTAIISQAKKDSGTDNKIYTVDTNSECVKAAEDNLRNRSLEKNVYFTCNDATSVCNEFIRRGKKFGFIFIDHSHEYKAVLEICRLLDKLLIKNGFCLFHDYNDSRNNDPDDKDYGVSQAVNDGLGTW